MFGMTSGNSMHAAPPYPGQVHVWTPPQNTMTRDIGLGMRRTAMALIGSVVPKLRLRTMQQARYHLTVLHIGRGHLSGMDDLLLTVAANIRR